MVEIVQLGEPVEHRGAVVAPLFPRRGPLAAYVASDEAIALGFRVTEVDEAGSVPRLRAVNPLDADVLLYDGEELLGAKQNRILDATVLVGARSEATIPVACVEQGRWSARSAAFSAAPHTAYPELRRVKAERSAGAPADPGAVQRAVWDEVRAKAARHGVSSPTGAQADVYGARTGALARLRAAFPLVPGQSGAVFALGPQLALDYVSRPDVFARLYPRLLAGYALDAAERLDGEPTPAPALERFLAGAGAAQQTWQSSAGRGVDVRLRGDGLVGSALRLDGELVQLSAFTSGPRAAAGPIARPSRRR